MDYEVAFIYMFPDLKDTKPDEMGFKNKTGINWPMMARLYLKFTHQICNTRYPSAQ